MPSIYFTVILLSNTLPLSLLCMHGNTHKVKFGVVGMGMLNDWVIAGSVIGNEKSPSSVITFILVTSMQHIGVKEKSISWFHFYLHKRENLHIQHTSVCLVHCMAQLTFITCSTLSMSAPICSPTHLCSILPNLCEPFNTWIIILVW